MNVVDGEAGLVMWKLSKLHKAATNGGFLDPENSLPSITPPITPQISKLKSFQPRGQDPPPPVSATPIRIPLQHMKSHFCQSHDPWTQRPTVSSRVEKGHWCSAGITPPSLVLPIWRADGPQHLVTYSSVTALHTSKGHHSHQSPLGPLYVVTMAQGNINGGMRHQEAHLPGRQVTSILALRNGLSH